MVFVFFIKLLPHEVRYLVSQNTSVRCLSVGLPSNYLSLPFFVLLSFCEAPYTAPYVLLREEVSQKSLCVPYKVSCDRLTVEVPLQDASNPTRLFL